MSEAAREWAKWRGDDPHEASEKVAFMAGWNTAAEQTAALRANIERFCEVEGEMYVDGSEDFVQGHEIRGKTVIARLRALLAATEGTP